MDRFKLNPITPFHFMHPLHQSWADPGTYHCEICLILTDSALKENLKVEFIKLNYMKNISGEFPTYTPSIIGFTTAVKG
jgi:hypothetical protein